MELAILRDLIVQKLKGAEELNKVAAAEFDGFDFSAADIAVTDEDGSCDVLRVTVVRNLEARQNADCATQD